MGPDIYVSALGTGSGADLTTPTTWTRGLAAARAWIAAGRAAPTVHVLDSDGPFYMRREASALTLDRTLRGVTIQAYAGHRPILSGGADLTGTWSAIGGGVYQATFAGPMTYTPRQLYVGGRPAELARTERHPAGWVVNLTSGLWNGTITAPDTSYASALHPTDMRIAMTSSGALWRYAIVRVVGISGTTITCHPTDVAVCTASWPTYGTAFSFDQIRHVEGLFEFVSLREGSFACHLEGDGSVTVRYRPRPGENMSTVSTILPVLDLDANPLVIGGTSGARATGITLRGLRIRHWGWSGIDTHGAINHGGDRMIKGSNLTSESAYYAMPGAVVMKYATNCAIVDCYVEHHGADGAVIDVGAVGCSFTGNVCAENASSGVRIGDDIRTVDSSHPSDDTTVIDGLTLANCVFADNSREHYAAGGLAGYYFRNSTLRNSVVANATYGGVVIGHGTGLNDPQPPYAGMVGFGLGFPDPSLVPGGAPWTTPPTACGGVTYSKLVGDVALLEPTFTDGGILYDNGAARVEAPDTWDGCVAKNGLVGYAYYADNAYRYKTISNLAAHGNINSQILSPPAIDTSFVNLHLAYGGTINSPRQPTVTESGTETTVGAWSAAGRAIADAAGLETAYAALRYPELTAEHVTAYATSYNGALAVYGPQLAISGRIVGAAPAGWLSAAGDPAPALTIDCGILHDVQRCELLLAADTSNFVVEGATLWDFSDAVVLWTQGATPIPLNRPIIVRAADRADLLGTYRFLRIRSTSGAQMGVAAFRTFAKPSDATLLSGSLDFTARPTGPWQTSWDGKALYARGADLCYRNSAARAIVGAGGITAQAGAGIALQGAATDGVSGLVIEGAYPSATTYLKPSAWGTAGSGDTYTAVTGPDGTTATGERVQVTSGGYAKYGSFTTAIAGQPFTITRWIAQTPSNPGGPWHGEGIDGGTYNHQQGSAPSAWTRYAFTWTAANTTQGQISFDTRNLGQPATPVAWPHAIDVYGGPVSGIVRAEAPITVAASALAATTYTDSAGYRRIVGGRCKPSFTLGISLSSANLGSARYLLVDQADATTFVRLNTDRTITISVAGTAIALPTAIPAWSIAAGAWTKQVQIDLAFGNGAPTGSVTIGGVTTSLGTGGSSHSSLTTQAWYVLSNNGASVLDCALHKLLWRA